jgi:hypothetical protein
MATRRRTHHPTQRLATHLQIAQSMFAIGWALALGARPKGLALGHASAAARAASAALRPLHLTAVANGAWADANAAQCADHDPCRHSYA